VAGEVYADESGALQRLRSDLGWYPDAIWRWLVGCQWHRVAQEEAFVARTAEVGDETGSAVTAARLVRDLMRLALLLDRRYAPYQKWLGTAFAAGSHPDGLPGHLAAAVHAGDVGRRDAALAAAYELLALRHNATGLTEPLDPHTRQLSPATGAGADAGRFAAACIATVTDPLSARAARCSEASIRSSTTPTCCATGGCAGGWRVSTTGLTPDQQFERARLARPCCGDHSARHLACGVTQGEGDDDRVVQRPDHGQNSGIRSIGESTHNPAKPSATFARRGTAGSRRSLRTSVNTVGQEAGGLLQETGRQPGGDDDEHAPHEREHAQCDQCSAQHPGIVGSPTVTDGRRASVPRVTWIVATVVAVACACRCCGTRSMPTR
jgi:hypothetical protein